MPVKPNEPQTPRTTPGWWWVLALLLGALMVPTLVQHLSDQQRTESIRYDQLVKYVKEGRVQWVQLGGQEIRGGYAKGEAPRPDKATLFTTGRVDDPRLVPLLEKHGVAFRGIAEHDTGQWIWWIYLLGMVVFMSLLFRRSISAAAGLQKSPLAFGKSRGKVIEQEHVGVDFDDVAGVEEAKDELREIVDFLKHPERYARLGARVPKGVLLVGPPGTGKTLLARAVAGEAGVPFISISGSEFVEMFVGVGAARVRDLFEQAAAVAPAIVFIDELDALGRSRGAAALGGNTNEEREQTLNQLLVELDGFEPNQGVILMAATNRPEVLDPALMRAGRFDRQILVDKPDRSGREQILRVHSRHIPLAPSVDLKVVAARTPGFAGADLANLVNEAALLAARESRSTVEMRDFSQAIDRVMAGLEKRSRIITDDEKRRVAYHEVGHALCGTLAGSGDEVHKISIVPRGMAALGYTMQLPTEERYLMTAGEIEAKLVGLFGGRAAEEVVFGEASTGAQDDLAKATRLARAMVTEYGLSERVGPVSIASEGPRFLVGPGGGVTAHHDVSDTLADVIDAEIKRIVSEARDQARALLRAHRDALETITARLLDEEVLEGEELRALLAAVKGPSDEAPEAPPAQSPPRSAAGR